MIAYSIQKIVPHYPSYCLPHFSAHCHSLNSLYLMSPSNRPITLNGSMPCLHQSPHSRAIHCPFLPPPLLNNPNNSLPIPAVNLVVASSSLCYYWSIATLLHFTETIYTLPNCTSRRSFPFTAIHLSLSLPHLIHTSIGADGGAISLVVDCFILPPNFRPFTGLIGWCC